MAFFATPLLSFHCTLPFLFIIRLAHFFYLFSPAVRRVLDEKNASAALADYFPQEISGPPPAPSKTGENWLNAAERKTLEIFRGLRDKLEETRKP